MKKILCVALTILLISSTFLFSACNLVSVNKINGEVATEQQGEKEEKVNQGETGEQGVQDNRDDNGDSGDQCDNGNQGHNSTPSDNGNQGNNSTPNNNSNQDNNDETTNLNDPIIFSLLSDGTYGVMAGKISNLDNIEIPATYNDIAVTSILPNAFQNVKSLKSITIPDSVTNIGKNAFNCCTSLTEITIGNGVTTIGVNAFEGCNSLKRIYIQDIAKWCKIDFYNYQSNPMCNYASSVTRVPLRYKLA